MKLHNDNNIKNKIPNGFIQNTSSWCWVVCAKLVGFEYLFRNLKVSDYSKLLKKYEDIDDINLKYGLPITICNLRKEYSGILNEVDTVDAWQLSIVLNVFQNKAVKNHLGTDVDKEKALRYVVTGSVNSEINVKTIGRFNSQVNLLHSRSINIKDLLYEKRYFIGNYVLQNNGTAHSVVVIFFDKNRVKIYDVWDGCKKIVTLEEAFSIGFWTSKGYGHIKWIQYIE